MSLSVAAAGRNAHAKKFSESQKSCTRSYCLELEKGHRENA